MSRQTRKFDAVVTKFLCNVIASLKNDCANNNDKVGIGKNIYAISLIITSPRADYGLNDLTADGFKNGSHVPVKQVAGCLRRVHNASPVMSIKWRLRACIAMAKYYRLNKSR